MCAFTMVTARLAWSSFSRSQRSSSSSCRSRLTSSAFWSCWRAARIPSAAQRLNSTLDRVFEVPWNIAPDGPARPFSALLLTLSSQIHVLPCQLLWRVVMKRAAFIALLVDAVEFCRRGLTTDVLLELRGLSRKLSGRRDRAVADVVDVALPIFGKLRVGKLEQALVRTRPCIRIVARLDLGKCLHHL